VFDALATAATEIGVLIVLLVEVTARLGREPHPLEASVVCLTLILRVVIVGESVRVQEDEPSEVATSIGVALAHILFLERLCFSLKQGPRS